MGRPKLTRIEEEMKKGKDFFLTRSQYITLTGADIPQKKSYTEKNSAVAKKASEYGYSITVITEVLEFKKI